MSKILTKALTYRAISSGATALVAFAVTGSPAAAGSVALVDAILKGGLYALHEYMWRD